MNLIEKFIQYINTNDISLFANIEYDDIKYFNIIILEILDWMKLQHKRYLWTLEGKKDYRKPLSIPLESSWGKLFIKLICNNIEFNHYFKIDDKKIDFSSNLNEDEKNTLCKLVYDNYKPIKYI